MVLRKSNVKAKIAAPIAPAKSVSRVDTMIGKPKLTAGAVRMRRTLQSRTSPSVRGRLGIVPAATGGVHASESGVGTSCVWRPVRQSVVTVHEEFCELKMSPPHTCH